MKTVALGLGAVVDLVSEPLASGGCAGLRTADAQLNWKAVHAIKLSTWGWMRRQLTPLDHQTKNPPAIRCPPPRREIRRAPPIHSKLGFAEEGRMDPLKLPLEQLLYLRLGQFFDQLNGRSVPDLYRVLLDQVDRAVLRQALERAD